MTLCLYADRRRAKLCALPEGHGGMMHLLQTAEAIRNWWPDA